MDLTLPDNAKRQPNTASSLTKTGLHTIGAGLSLLIAVGLLAALWGRMINHDTAWYLLATREWLDGAR
ncbi:MAG: hypothetical protein WBH14_09750, partial [Albidovulum sp.]